jgi:phage terminase large subunit-like protein
VIDPVEYESKILSGEIPSCEYVKMAVKRQQKDLKRRKWDYWFDRDEGLMRVAFFPNFLVHAKAEFAGKPFELDLWQAWCTYVFYGWKKKKNNARRFKYSYIEIPRKNGKTTWKAGEGLMYMVIEEDFGSELYCAATKEKQARQLLNFARGIAKKSPLLKQYLKVQMYTILGKENDSFIEALGSDSDKQDGLHISMGIIDELHAHKDFKMVEVLETGCSASFSPIINMITTAGFNKNYPCYNYRKFVIDIISGKIEQDDVFGIIFTIDEGDDWKSVDSIIKANPSWEHMNQDDIIQAQQKAIKYPSAEVGFKTKHLNVWTDSEQVFISDDAWMECDLGDVDFEKLKEVPAWGGLDIAATVDLNALCLVWEIDEILVAKWWFWIPESKVHEKEDIVDYYVWSDQGYIMTMPGNALDDEVMARDILDIFAYYKIGMVSYDRWYSGGVIGRLVKAGFDPEKLNPFGQGPPSMSGPIKELERRVLLKTFNHMGNPVARWMNSNVTLAVNAAGDVKFDRQKSIDKIDGMVALAMGMGTWMGNQEDEFTGEIRFLENL